jgi:hypothetical protein
MKKYKLIKEYPGSPKLGTEVEKESNNKFSYFYRSGDKRICVYNEHIENQPEYWEEVRNICFVVSEIDYNQGNYTYFQAWTVYKIYEDNKRDSVLNYFITEEGAENFVLNNKPCLSYNEVRGVVGNGFLDSKSEKELLRVIKSKL